MQTIEIFGYLAMIIIPIALAPQVLKSWKTKSTKDISIMWSSVYVLGLVCWLIYGLGIDSIPLVVSAVIEGMLASSLLVLKLRYG
jgi:MtN3 and saliva related transmembrane protein